MMKRYLAVLLSVVLLLALFSGCEKSESAATEPTAPEETEPVQAPQTAVDASVFYFTNELEYNRLYSQRFDGTDLRLVQDVSCYDVRQVGNSVYFMDGHNLCVYHIPSGEKSVLIAGVLEYVVNGNDLVYFRDSAEVFQSEMRYRNLETGTDFFLESLMRAGGCDIANGILYYTKYDPEIWSAQLCVCDLTTFETNRIASELHSFYELHAVADGVYFEGITEDYSSAQCFASADGAAVYKVDAGLTDDCLVFHASEGNYLCICTFYDDLSGSQCRIHRHNSDGTTTDILHANDGGYFTVCPLSGERWLVKHTYYDGWGTQDAYGEYENFVNRLEYLLMDAQGNTTPIDTAGQLGKMFSGGDFPIMDSSTARKPVTRDIYNLFVANFGYEGTPPLCSTTHGAWLNIADRQADIALLAAPTKEELDYLNERNVSIDMKLYGGDGLVFIGNAANPVSDLSHEQIIAIYQGKITNWSEVGGPDQPITVYYRDAPSGSQRLFETMVFKDLALPDYEKLGFSYMDEMSTIVNIVMADPYSIGYSIMTYLDDVYANEELKVFAVDGTVPSVDTIKDSTYPYHTQGYVVIRSDEPEGSPARRLYDWFGSPVCDEILYACDITPLQGGVG